MLSQAKQKQVLNLLTKMSKYDSTRPTHTGAIILWDERLIRSVHLNWLCDFKIVGFNLALIRQFIDDGKLKEDPAELGRVNGLYDAITNSFSGGDNAAIDISKSAIVIGHGITPLFKLCDVCECAATLTVKSIKRGYMPMRFENKRYFVGQFMTRCEG